MRRAAIAGPSSVVWEQSRSNQILQTVKHPTSNGFSSMRKRPSSSSDQRQNKRSKSSESDDGVIVLDGPDDSPKNGQRTSVSSGQLQSFTLDPTDVVNFFRLSASKLECVFLYLADHAISVIALLGARRTIRYCTSTWLILGPTRNATSGRLWRAFEGADFLYLNSIRMFSRLHILYHSCYDTSEESHLSDSVPNLHLFMQVQTKISMYPISGNYPGHYTSSAVDSSTRSLKAIVAMPVPSSDLATSSAWYCRTLRMRRGPITNNCMNVAIWRKP